VLRAVSTNPQVDGVSFSVELGPDPLAATFPALGDRVTDENQVNLPSSDALVETLMTCHPATLPGYRFDGVVCWFLGYQAAGSKDQGKYGEQDLAAKGLH
jgi:hypothetical protein